MHRKHSRAFAAALALCGSAAVHAEGNPWTLAFQETLNHDSNVFRAPRDAADRPTDYISTTSVIGSLNQPIGRETLKVNGEFDINRFRFQHQLDSMAHSLSSELDWSTVGNVSGEAGFSNSRQLYRYNTTQATQVVETLNIETENQGFFRARVGVVTDLTLGAEANLYRRAFSNTAYRFNDQLRRDAAVSATWRSNPDLSFTAKVRRAIGEYPDSGNQVLHRPDDKFDRNDFNLGVQYAPSGESSLSITGGKASESHSLDTFRTNELWTSSANWKWQPTGHLLLQLGYTRDNDTGANDTTVFIFPAVDTDARLRSTWNGSMTFLATGKVRLTAQGSYSNRVLAGTQTVFGNTTEFRGSDRLYTASVSAQWQASRAVSLSCTAARERRATAGDPPPGITYAYGAVVLSCSGQFALN